MRKGVGRTVFRELFWDDTARKLGKNRKYIWTGGRPRTKGGSGGGESGGLRPLTIRDENFHTEKHLLTHWRRIVQTA